MLRQGLIELSHEVTYIGRNLPLDPIGEGSLFSSLRLGGDETPPSASDLKVAGSNPRLETQSQKA